MSDSLWTDITSLVERVPGVNGGRPLLAGTGVSVLQVAALFKLGYTPEQIRDDYPQLDLARAYAGVASYLANREVIDAELDAEDRAFDEAATRAAAVWPASA